MTSALRISMMVMALYGVSACSENSDGTPKPSETPASRICDGTLDKPAVAALQRLGGADSFQELTGENYAGEPSQFSLTRAVMHLHDKVQKRSRCSVYLLDGSSGAPLIQVDFKASDTHPTRHAVEKAEPDSALTFYPLGVYAATSNENSTVLYFRCTTKGPDGETPYVDAGIFSTTGQQKEQSTSKDRMTILNSVSRRLADELGCADEAQLPATVPDGETVEP